MGDVQQFKVGDKVQWTSQAAGSTKTKVGVVVGVVPAASSIERHPVFRDWNERLCYGGGLLRNHESYLVAVEYGTPQHGIRKALYWPRVKGLRMVGQ